MVLIPLHYLSDQYSAWTDTPNSTVNKHHEGAEVGGSLTSHTGTSYHTKYDQPSAMSFNQKMTCSVLHVATFPQLNVLSVSAVKLPKNYPDSS